MAIKIINFFLRLFFLISSKSAIYYTALYALYVFTQFKITYLNFHGLPTQKKTFAKKNEPFSLMIHYIALYLMQELMCVYKICDVEAGPPRCRPNIQRYPPT